MQSSNKRVGDNKRFYRRFTNISLMIVGVVMSFSGLFIQIRYHIQNSLDTSYATWAIIHKWSSLLFIEFIVFHILLHAKWYKIVIEKRLFKKNRITLFLTATMIVAASLGFVAWMLDVQSNHPSLRHILIEIHDKIGVLFFVLLLIHVIKRGKWYVEMR